MTAGAFPIAGDADPLLHSLRQALAAIEVLGPDAAGEVVLRLHATWGVHIDHHLGSIGQSEAADAWLAWRDLLA